MPAWRTRRSLYDCHVATIAAQALIQVSCGTRPASMSISISYGSVQDNSSVLSEPVISLIEKILKLQPIKPFWN